MEVVWTRVAAYALCRDDGRILLTRFVAPGHPDHGKWTMPGGRMEWGESARETAHRELLEETGLTAALGEVAGVFSRWFTAQESARGEPGHVIGIVFHASELSGELRTEFDDEDTTDDAQWFPIADVDALPHVELVDFALELTSGQGHSNPAGCARRA
ncbi:MAG: NUDIX domain-containing protein [Acidimicrobiales bacterium]